MTVLHPESRHHESACVGVVNGLPKEAFIDVGLVPNDLVGQIMREADVVVFPNRCGGGTNVVAMEWMACGIPTVLSANTGHLDLIDGAPSYPLRSQGKVVESARGWGRGQGWGESDVDEVVAALEEVYADREAAQRRGRQAARFMEDWTSERQIGRLLSTIEAL